jgi:hypothetical protein
MIVRETVPEVMAAMSSQPVVLLGPRPDPLREANPSEPLAGGEHNAAVAVVTGVAFVLLHHWELHAVDGDQFFGAAAQAAHQPLGAAALNASSWGEDGFRHAIGLLAAVYR